MATTHPHRSPAIYVSAFFLGCSAVGGLAIFGWSFGIEWTALLTGSVRDMVLPLLISIIVVPSLLLTFTVGIVRRVRWARIGTYWLTIGNTVVGGAQLVYAAHTSRDWSGMNIIAAGLLHLCFAVLALPATILLNLPGVRKAFEAESETNDASLPPVLKDDDGLEHDKE
jgi:hypothetical protein